MRKRTSRGYMPVDQLPYCCLPACLQMVLERRSLAVPGQQLIGTLLGLVIPPHYSDALPGTAVSVHRPPAGWGTRIHLPRYKLGRFLRSCDGRLRARLVSPAGLRDPTSWIAEKLARPDADVLACFRYSALYDSGASSGHVSVIDRLDGDHAILIEPQPGRGKLRRVPLGRLFHAMRVHGRERFGGLILIDHLPS